ncbi:HAMP domain-containing sensor histidine kinase [Paenibacillus bovis]|uniref:histidine kinase n=1 Tax=Paenibacillus bovis TaxID=1616788 RepID=A0A172ZBA9_9BACL|nr:HAMP domain-containing sensor histidine kinase [Paenibacillus bovis]ANF94931.1 two-component sensor histidine kinase [Paenibacillus bovis]
MKSKEENYQINHSLFSIMGYVRYFLMITFVVSASILLFFGGSNIPPEFIRTSLPITFANLFLLTLLCCLVNGMRRKFVWERPIRRILEATYQVTQGDFHTRIQPVNRWNGENELDVIINNFNKMAEELSSIEMLRTDFIANVSHELKTPLAVIQNYSTMLQNPALSVEKRIEYAHTITDASRRLSDLITNILKLNKLENQQIFPEAKTYNLGEQLCECMLGFENVWEEKALEIDIAIEEDIQVKADAELMSLIWNNLFSNALKFSNPHGKVTIRLTTENDLAVVQVTDTGCGMLPEVQKHIFEKFYQDDSSRATRGNGLGLALVKRVVDITGCNIAVKSSPGEGSTFIVKMRRDGRR